MSSLYNRAEIYDLLESEKRNEAIGRLYQLCLLGSRHQKTDILRDGKDHEINCNK